MSLNNASAKSSQDLAIEKLHLFQSYFQNQEQLKALSEAQPQIAARIRQIEAEMRVLEAGRAQSIESGKGGNA